MTLTAIWTTGCEEASAVFARPERVTMEMGTCTFAIRPAPIRRRTRGANAPYLPSELVGGRHSGAMPDDPDAKLMQKRDRLVALLSDRTPRQRTATYVGVVRTAAGNFAVEFPDLPGCITAGKTMRDTRRLAAEVLASHLDGMVTDGRPIPAPRSLGEIRDDPTCQDATTLILVEVPAKPPEQTRDS